MELTMPNSLLFEVDQERDPVIAPDMCWEIEMTTLFLFEQLCILAEQGDGLFTVVSCAVFPVHMDLKVEGSDHSSFLLLGIKMYMGCQVEHHHVDCFAINQIIQ